MARTTGQQFSQEEDRIYTQWCEDHGILTAENAELIGRSFRQADVDVTRDRLDASLDGFKKAGLKFKSAARLEAERVAKENPHAVDKFAQWFDNQSVLVREGDEGFHNFSVLLEELRGRDITEQNIYNAMTRINSSGSSRFSPQRKELYYIPETRKRVDPRQKQADPGQKTGQFIEPSLPEWKRRSLLREQQAQANPNSADSKKVLESAAQQRAEGRRGNTHSQTAQIQRIFVMKQGSNDIDWASTDEARDRMQQSFSNRSIR
jgi:hypothetical protein